jgi:DNA repair protein SbcC/Rad50
MEFIKKFLKPKWQHANPDVRRQALTELNSVEQLLTFIAAESVADLRRAAVERIRDEQTLENLLDHHHDDVRQFARNHWLTILMPAGSSLKSIQSSQTLVRIAGLTQDQELRLQAIALITDAGERFRIAAEHPVAKVRMAAAEGISDLTLLQQLLDIAQGKDKAVYRLCKDRLQEHKAAAEARAAQAERIEHLFQQVRQLNRLGYSPDFNGRLQVLNKQTLELQDALSAEQKSALETELANAASILRQHDEEEQRQAEANARTLAAQQQQASLLEQLQTLLNNSNADTDPAALQQQAQALDELWRATLADHKPAADIVRRYENCLQATLNLQACLQQLLQQSPALNEFLATEPANELKALQQTIKKTEQWQQRLRWPEQLPQPDWSSALAARKQQAEQAIARLNQQQSDRIDTLQGQITELEQHIQNGHLKDASKLYGQISTHLRQVDNRAAQNLQRQARNLGAQLNEMRDWQGFVTTPKKEALCEAMEALIGTTDSPDILADKIQVMQDEWKTLHSSTPDRELWERFQAAGDKAFEPCREYFAQVARQREQNIELRNQLIAELDRYETDLDWVNADWKVVQKTLEAARETFRTYSPVDRSAHNDTNDRFRAVCDRIYAHIQAEYDRNLDIKTRLIEQAEAQIEAEDLSAAIDVIKQLQQDWKEVGVTPRAADQKLWKQFRARCDAVFARLDQARAERKARLDDAVMQAETLVQQASALLEADLPVREKQQQLEELELSFAAMELPKSAHQRLRKSFSEIASTLENQQQQAHIHAEQARWQGVIDRLLALSGNDEALWQQAAELPKEYRELDFDRAWQQRAEHNQASNEALDLCIQMEVLAGVETAAADQSRRMALQVQRLAQGLGQVQDIDAERQALLQQWLNVSASPAQQQRFANAFRASL